MPKPEDELTEEELPEIGLHEGDRPISTDAYLDEDGICFFPGPEAQMPSQLRIAAPVDFIAFVKALVVLDNASEKGWKEIPYTYPEKPDRGDVLGLVLNKGAIEMLQSKYAGKAFLLKEPNGDDWLTLAEWNSKFNTDGLEVLARMRWEWFTKGGRRRNAGAESDGNRPGRPCHADGFKQVCQARRERRQEVVE